MNALAPTELELTILMPCLNEAETIVACVEQANDFLARAGIPGEVLVADNGSTDGSQALAKAAGARVVNAPVKGYGGALAAGIQAAQGRFVIMGDADLSYDFSRLDAFVDGLRGGADIVVGNRFKGGIAPGAMPFLHRYLGNPVLSFAGRMLFNVPAGDFHCGLRGFRRQAVLDLDLRTSGMEFASEMLVVAALKRLRIDEVPTTLKPDGRSRPPHLRTWRDGWRHLRFLLIYSPRWLFIYPGAALMLFGLALTIALLPGPVQVMPGIELDVHTLIGAGVVALAGLQSMLFGLVAQRYAEANGLIPRSIEMKHIQRHATLERLLLLGGLVIVGGLVGAGVSLASWSQAGFGPLAYQSSMRLFVPAAMAILAGLQLTSAAFLMAIAGMVHHKERP